MQYYIGFESYISKPSKGVDNIVAEFVIMPKTGVTVTECALSTWYKHDGEQVEAGEPLFAYETDKTCADENAPVSGTLLKCFCEEGDIVGCLEPVCVIGQPGENYEDAHPAAPAAEVSAESPAAAVPSAAVSAPASSTDRPYAASPRARTFAERLDVDLSSVTPTGPEHRIIGRDVELAAEQKPAAVAAPAIEETAPQGTAYTDTKLGSVRKIIAKRMSESLRDIPQLTMNAAFDATNVNRLRAEFKACTCNPALNGVSLNDMLIFALSRVLPHHPALNANLLDGETLRVFSGVHIGIAVDTERGLLVPVLKNAQAYSLIELSSAVHALIAEARAGTISPDKLSGASFTISNLGSMRIEHFTPVINGPQTGILGVGCPVYRSKPTASGELVNYPAIGLSLTFDHRALDGAPAARFMVELISYLEQFSLMQIQ